MSQTAIDWVPVLVRLASSLAWSDAYDRVSFEPWWVAVKVVSALLFVVAGLKVARDRASALEGGV